MRIAGQGASPRSRCVRVVARLARGAASFTGRSVHLVDPVSLTLILFEVQALLEGCLLRRMATFWHSSAFSPKPEISRSDQEGHGESGVSDASPVRPGNWHGLASSSGASAGPPRIADATDSGIALFAGLGAAPRQAQVGQTDGMFMPRPLARVRLLRGLRAQIARSLERRLRRRKPSSQGKQLGSQVIAR